MQGRSLLIRGGQGHMLAQHLWCLRCCMQDVTAQVLLQLVGRTQASRSSQQAAADIEAVRQSTRLEEAAADLLRVKATQIEVIAIFSCSRRIVGVACLSEHIKVEVGDL